MRENKTLKENKLKEYYLEQGVIVKDRNYLLIPKVLKKEYETILKAFNMHHCSFYGVDPEQEKQKELYLAKGVMCVKTDSSGLCKKTYKIPEALKDDEEKIKDAFEIKYSTDSTDIVYY